MTKAMRGARHPIRRSHTELRECCQAAVGRNMGCCRRGEKGRDGDFSEMHGEGEIRTVDGTRFRKGVFVVSLREERKRKGKIRESCR